MSEKSSRRRLIKSLGALSVGTMAGCPALDDRSPEDEGSTDRKAKTSNDTPVSESPTQDSSTEISDSSETETEIGTETDSCNQGWNPEFNWQIDLPSFPGGILAGSDSIFCPVENSDGPAIYSIDPQTGETTWTAKTTHRGAIDHAQNILASAEQNHLRAYSSSSGALEWSSEAPNGGRFSTIPRVTSNAVVVGAVNQETSHRSLENPYLRIYSFDPSDGSTNWYRELETEPEYLITDDGEIFIGMSDDTVMLLDDSNNVQWTRDNPEPSEGYVDSRPSFSGNYVFTVINGNVYAIDRKTGAVQWRSDQSIILSIKDSVVYCSTHSEEEQYLRALDIETGNLSWELKLNTTPAEPLSFINWKGQTGYFSLRSESENAPSKLVAVDRDNHCIIDELVFSSRFFTSPVIQGGSILVADLPQAGPRLTAINIHEGVIERLAHQRAG